MNELTIREMLITCAPLTRIARVEIWSPDKKRCFRSCEINPYEIQDWTYEGPDFQIATFTCEHLPEGVHQLVDFPDHSIDFNEKGWILGGYDYDHIKYVLREFSRMSYELRWAGIWDG